MLKLILEENEFIEQLDILEGLPAWKNALKRAIGFVSLRSQLASESGSLSGVVLNLVFEPTHLE